MQLNKKINNFKIQSTKRLKLIRKRLLDVSQNVGALHLGGSFSCLEILDTIYFYFLKKNKDKIILSKGHSAIAQYAILDYLKILPKKKLNQYCQDKSDLGVHPEFFTPGILASTGSLGHGIGIAAGLSISSKKNELIFLVISDGELMEGSTWELSLLISSLRLNNIIMIIDHNGIQSATRAKDTHPTLYPIKSKFLSFGWSVGECNGHNQKEIIKKISKRKKNKPFLLIANTIKGYPISFMKNKPVWHYRSPNKDEYKKAIGELK